MWRIIRCLFATAFLLSASASTVLGVEMRFGAGGQGTSGPVRVTSSEVAFDQENGLTIFIGSVVVTQGELTLRCEYAEVFSPANSWTSIDLIVIRDGVVLESSESNAVADSGEYNLVEGMIELFGNVRVTNADSEFSAERLIYDVESGRSRLLSKARATVKITN